MKHLEYIQLASIRAVFKAYFKGFDLELPENPKPWEDWEHMASGWSIVHSLGYTKENEPCLYVAANHRMTNPRHFMITESGACISLPSYSEFFSFDPSISGDIDIQRQAYHAFNQGIAAQHRLVGLCSNQELANACSLKRLSHYQDFHFFWETESPFSQWHKCSFKAFGIDFCSAEQYMMYQKALLFNDESIAEKILQSSNPRKQKELGRQVANFEPSTWNANCRRIVYEANRYKFMQNPALQQALLDTGELLLVESSPDDAIWGIGLHRDDPRSSDISTWLGSNWLGLALTLLKDDLKKSVASQSNI